MGPKLSKFMRGFMAMTILGWPGAGMTATLCSNQEEVIFSCPLKKSKKIVSLCASPDLAKDRGWLAYRFGTPASVELEYPERGSKGSAARFRHAHYFRYQTDRTEVSFQAGGYSYTVFSSFDAAEKPPRSQGVRVSRGNVSSEFACAGPASANFAPLEEAVPCDKESALATCK